MRTSGILTTILISIFIQLAESNNCNAQSDFWNTFMQIFKKEEPEADISGKNEIEGEFGLCQSILPHMNLRFLVFLYES
ncbi:MAG: hypothetical protein ACOC44_19875 [Promethearchaeia archaeon]